jgi:hypothetical protein
MSIIGSVKYREHCVKQGRSGIKPLTRRQAKALRQHEADPNKRDGLCSYKERNMDTWNPTKGRFE